MISGKSTSNNRFSKRFAAWTIRTRKCGLFASTLLFFLLIAGVGLQAQNLVSVSTTNLPAFDVSVRHSVIGTLDDRPVVLGGWMADEDSLVWHSGGWILSEDKDSWISFDGAGVLPNSAEIADGPELVVVGGESDGAWSRQALILGWSGNRVETRTLPDLPQPLANPAGVFRSGTLYIAGFSESDPESKTVSLYTLKLDGENPEWEALPDVEVVSEGDLIMASQNEGVYLFVNPGPDSEIHAYRYLEKKGWAEQSSSGIPLHTDAAIALGQVHIGFLSSSAQDAVDSGHVVFSFSTVTDSWSNVGHWAENANALVSTPLGTGFVAAEVDDGGTLLNISELAFDVGKRNFYWLDYLAVFIYLLGMILIGVYFSRRENGTEDFFVGGRKMPWWAVGFSLYATGTSAISFMAIPAKSYATDWLYLAQNAVGLVAIIPVAMVIVPLIRRLSITSTYEYLEMRFHPIIRLMGSFLAIVYQLGARMSVVLFLPALALSAVTGVDVITSILFMGVIATVYTVLGGIKAVIWTDVVQVVVLLGGALLCLIIIITGIDGGVGGLLDIAAADNKMHMFDWRLDLTIPTIWLFFILATTDTITWPRDQVMVQRVLSTKSSKEAGFSVWTLAAIVVPGSLLFFSLGTGLYGFYKVNPERLSPLLDMDATLPFFIAAELPAGVAGLIIAALFAASMSTLDSSMNSVATIIVVDFYKRFKKKVTDEASLRLAKWITVATGVFGTGFAIILSNYSLPSLWDTFIALTGLLGGGFGGVYALGMFTRRATWHGALVGIVSSIGITLAVQAYTPIHVLLYTGVAITSCIVIGYIVSLFFPIQDTKLEGLTVFLKDNPNGRA